MRIDPPVRGNHSVRSQEAGAHAAKDKDAPNVDSKKAVQVGRPDPVKLSPEATLKWAQARLEAHVNDELKAQFAAAGVDMDAAQGQDWSPDATASRIFDFASGLIGSYREQHPELAEADVVNKFEALIRGAVDKGYGDAIEILTGMGASDEVLGTAKATIDRVRTQFDDFFASLRIPPTPLADDTSATAQT